jgi:glycosyltransferase involved in cell wall biosynthesis
VTPLALHPHFEELVASTEDAIRCGAPYQVVHSHNWLSGAVARRLTRQRARHVHSILSLGRVRLELGEEATSGDRIRDNLEVEVFRDADVLVTVAPSERDQLRRLYPEIEHDRIAIVPYGVDPDLFHPRPQSPDDFVLRQARRSAQGTD